MKLTNVLDNSNIKFDVIVNDVTENTADIIKSLKT